MNSIILLLFTLISLAPCATEAMGALLQSNTSAKSSLSLMLQKAIVQRSHIPVRPINDPLQRSLENNNHLIQKLGSCPGLGTFVVKGQWRVPQQKQYQLVSLFEQLKTSMGTNAPIPLMMGHIPEPFAAITDCLHCDHKVIVVNYAMSKGWSTEVQRFLLAHELAHAVHDDMKKIQYVHHKSPQEITEWHHQIEYAADAQAARIIGSVKGGVEFFERIQKPATPLHPASSARAAHLIALEKLGQLYCR